MNSWIQPPPLRPSSALGLEVSVRARGRGIIILSGPSSCGKGVVADSLRRTLHLPRCNHVSMGDALRTTIDRARQEPAFLARLGEDYGIWPDRCVYDTQTAEPGQVSKARVYEAELEELFGAAPSQLDWLEFCVTSGLLVPDRWSERIIEGTIADLATQHEAVILLDGYPRTEVAARHVMELAARLSIPIIKVIHLSVSKREMHRRALGRSRPDDTPEKLERRYAFYVDHVQPSVELLKAELGSNAVALIDAHQPAYKTNGQFDLRRAVRNVANSVLMSIGVSRHILESLGDPPLEG
jgi:adenylate kinase family enzyme